MTTILNSNELIFRFMIPYGWWLHHQTSNLDHKSYTCHHVCWLIPGKWVQVGTIQSTGMSSYTERCVGGYPTTTTSVISSCIPYSDRLGTSWDHPQPYLFVGNYASGGPRIRQKLSAQHQNSMGSSDQDSSVSSLEYYALKDFEQHCFEVAVLQLAM